VALDVWRARKGDGQFDTPHGIWIDNRPAASHPLLSRSGESASAVVHPRRQHLKTLDGFILPANLDSRGCPACARSERALTFARKNDMVIAHLGERSAWREQVLKDNMKLAQREWRRLGLRQVSPSTRRVF